MRTLYGASKAERLAYRSSFIPKNAEPIYTGDELAIYRYPIGDAGACGVVVFWGSAGKPSFHYSYRKPDQAKQFIEHQLDRLSLQRIETLRKKATAKAWTNPLTVGTILSTCWGYDQTNVEFYTVTRVSGRRVWIRQIAAEYEETGFMSGQTWPAMPIEPFGEETMHTAQPSGETGASIKIQHHYAQVETGRSHYTSSYA